MRTNSLNDNEILRAVLLAGIDFNLDYADVEGFDDLKRYLDETRIAALAEECSSYRDYLASERWHELRRQALDRDLETCRDCGAPASEVHHIVYPRVFGQESLDDPASL